MIRTITSEDLRDCARLFVKVFSEWPYEESWSVTQAHHYLSRFWKFDPEHCLLVLEKDDVRGTLCGWRGRCGAIRFWGICSRNWSSFFRLPTGVLNNRIAQEIPLLPHIMQERSHSLNHSFFLGAY